MSDDPSVTSLAGGSTGLDGLDMFRGNRSPRSRLAMIVPAMRSSLGLVFGAGRSVAVVTFGLQALVAGLSGVHILVGEKLLRSVLVVGGRRASLATSVVPVSVLAGTTLVSLVAGSLLSQRQRLLSELVQRASWRRLLDVAAAVDLTSFERADFYDRLLRVRQT